MVSASHGKAHPICWEGACEDESVSEILARVEERERFPCSDAAWCPKDGLQNCNVPGGDAEGLRLMAIRCRGATQGSEKAIKG